MKTIADQPLTVLHAVPDTWLPVTQNWLYNQVRHLPNDTVSHIVCTRRTDNGAFDVPNVHETARQPHRRAIDALGTRLGIRHHASATERVVRSHRPDILHSHFADVGWRHLALCRRYGLRHVVTFYGLDVNYLPRAGWLSRYQRLFKEVDLVLCEGPHMARCVVELGCAAEKVAVHRLGVRVRDIAYQPCARRATEPLRILLAAQFREKKGLPDAIDAIGRFRRMTGAAVEVTLIGEAGPSRADARERQRVFDAINHHDLRPHMRLLGRQPYARLLEEARTHHVFMHPSVTADDGQTEGGAPIALLDMAAAGIAIISTNHCDIPQIVVHGRTGLVADECDCEGLARQLVTLIENPEHVSAMAGAARRHVETHFDAAAQGAVLAARYRCLRAGKLDDAASSQRPAAPEHGWRAAA